MEYIKRTKIVATLGPGCENQLVELIDAGVNVARLNFSHGDHAEHQQRWEKLQAAVKKTGKRIAIMLDTQGPKIRTGTFTNNSMDLIDGEEVTLIPGNGEGGIINGKKTIYVNYQNLLKLLSKHKIVYFADGLMEVKVEKLEKDKAIAKVVTGGKISDRKGVNIPRAEWELPPLREKDILDVKWGIEHDVDYIAQSFVRSAKDVKELRKLLDENNGKEIKIIAKIEEYPAVQNLDEIIASADGIMVARGDLGVQMPIEQVPSVQKHIIEKCNEAMKPVITATQMLESMTTNPFPTRAEVTDVANAILDGSDAVMLSGETSIGKYPIKTVQMMTRIIQHTEQSLLEYGQFDRHHCKVEDERNTTLSIAKAASKIAT
ncbi:MAG: pyruvate kinase, partial [Candidatus Micrarchaeota archaeon]